MRPIQSRKTQPQRQLAVLRIERRQRRRRRSHTMALIEEVPDGGYGRADEVFVIPAAYRAKE